MSEKNHPRALVERYLTLSDQRKDASKVLDRAESAYKTLERQCDTALDAIRSCVGHNIQCRVFRFDTRGVLVEWEEGVVTIQVLELE